MSDYTGPYGLADAVAREAAQPKRDSNPYYVQQTPRGSVVVCRGHLVSDELKTGEAHALARALNMEHETRMVRK